MYIEFRTRKLEKCFLERREREKAWTSAVARRCVEAVNLLRAVEHPSHLGAFPQFAYEPLTQNRRGQHSLKLGDRVRLIFTVQKGSEVLVARIEEVSKTHYDH